mgnify:CR=1 FL=1
MKDLYFGQGRVVLGGILNGFNFKEFKKKYFIDFE